MTVGTSREDQNDLQRARSRRNSIDNAVLPHRLRPSVVASSPQNSTSALLLYYSRNRVIRIQEAFCRLQSSESISIGSLQMYL
ncbi:unnamed protein product [Haemonchus placei]|uniref:Uncharacterized protein n=1 Tax=Haemonchus placei TaxID=6290 RepID=A0A3P7ULN7_HAEPC|nr:unnamed protein product [Haemonchus placei]